MQLSHVQIDASLPRVIHMRTNTYVEPGLRAFINNAKQYPFLTPEREHDIAIAWHDRRNRRARDELAHSHLRLVVKVARAFAGYGLPLSDLVSEGNLGLLHAIDKFDPGRGTRFATYALWWIRAAIQEYILRSWSLVKIGTTAAQRRLFFNLQRVKLQLQNFDGSYLAPEMVAEIAAELDVRESDVIEMDNRLRGLDKSLNVQLAGEAMTEWIELLPDDRPGQDSIVADADESLRQRALLKIAMKDLNPREREIVVERRLKDKPATLDELSQRYAVSPERVRQIEVKAFEKLRATITANSQRKSQREFGLTPEPALRT
jgi:RNA polymerase sigma-32 factor